MLSLIRFILMATLLATTPAAAEAPKVVVSIKPLHSLVAAVMKGIGSPALMMDGAASPHAYALRPSEAKALSAAQVIVWVGPGLETFLEKPLASLGGTARLVTMAALPGMALLPPREWTDGHDDHDDHAHDEATIDYHLWLSIGNARALVAALAEELAALDPANADAYRANARAADAALDALDAEIRARLAPVAGKRFMVFHDAYQYFEQSFGVPATGTVTLTPEKQPGAKRIRELRRLIADTDTVCLFREPQFSPRIIEPIVEKTPVRVAVLDPLGADLPAGPDMYFKLMRGIAAALADCLAGKG